MAIDKSLAQAFMKTSERFSLDKSTSNPRDHFE
jgi:hypothetical protein